MKALGTRCKVTLQKYTANTRLTAASSLRPLHTRPEAGKGAGVTRSQTGASRLWGFTEDALPSEQGSRRPGVQKAGAEGDGAHVTSGRQAAA